MNLDRNKYNIQELERGLGVILVFLKDSDSAKSAYLST